MKRKNREEFLAKRRARYAKLKAAKNTWEDRQIAKDPDWYRKKYLERRAHHLAYAKKYSARPEVKARVKQQVKLRRKTDINFRLATNLRDRVRGLLRGKVKGGSSVQDLGCSISGLRFYLECKFQPGMSWDNYGEWHIDHIYPLSKVDLTDREQVLKVYHYSNLQPLWAADNISKRDKLNWSK